MSSSPAPPDQRRALAHPTDMTEEGCSDQTGAESQSVTIRLLGADTKVTLAEG